MGLQISIDEAIHTDPYAFSDEMYSDRIYGINVDQYDSPKFVVNKFIGSQKMVKIEDPQLINRINKIKLKRALKNNEEVFKNKDNLNSPETVKNINIDQPKHLFISLLDVIRARDEIISEVENLKKFFEPNCFGDQQLHWIWYRGDFDWNYFDWFRKAIKFREFNTGFCSSKYIPSKSEEFADAFFIVPDKTDDIDYYITNIISKMEEYFKLAGVWPRICIDARYYDYHNNPQNKYLYYYYCFDNHTNTLVGFKVFSKSDEAGKKIIQYIYDMQHKYPNVDLSYHITAYNNRYLDSNKRNLKNTLNDILYNYDISSIEIYENVFIYSTFNNIVSSLLYKLSWAFKHYNQQLHPLIIVNMKFELRLCMLVDDKPVYWSFKYSDDLYNFIDALNSSEDLDKFVESLNYKKEGE